MPGEQVEKLVVVFANGHKMLVESSIKFWIDTISKVGGRPAGAPHYEAYNDLIVRISDIVAVHPVSMCFYPK